jgi:hypothetical protein
MTTNLHSESHNSRHMTILNENLTLVIGIPIATMIFFLMCHKTFQSIMRGRKHYDSLSEPKQHFYINNLVGLVNAVLCLIWVPVMAYQCDPPVKFRQDNLFMGNIHIRNDWCVDHSNVFEILGVSYFLGYLFYDFLI